MRTLLAVFVCISLNNMRTATEDFDLSPDNMSGMTHNINGVIGNFKRMMTINSAKSDNYAHMQAISASRRPCKNDCTGMIDAQPQAL